MTREHVIFFAAIAPALHLPERIEIHPAVIVEDVAQFIATAVSRLDSESALLRQLAAEALQYVIN